MPFGVTPSHFAAAAFVVLGMGALTLSTWDTRFTAAAVFGLIVSLIAASEPRLVGDAGEYVAMSLNLSRLAPPSLAAENFPHFWFYSLIAAPFVRVAQLLGLEPFRAFTTINVLLIAAAFMILRTRASAAVILLIVTGPILWWLDKAHTEAFTYSLLIVAMALVREAPWWSAAALGVAATQNPPFAAALIIVVAVGVQTHGWRERRVWLGGAIGAAFAAIHPLYYRWHLGVWSGLTGAVSPHVPTLRELTTVMVDLNIGILRHDPWFALAVLVAVATVRRRLYRIDAAAVGVTVIALLFLVSFTQTSNVNAGGTPGPSRYGLWLLPLGIPLLQSAPERTRSLRWTAAASLVWCAVCFAPERAERYLQPDALASGIWQRTPSLDNPLAEVFAERVSGTEPSPRPPIATAGCEKVLLLGRNADPEWPPRCVSAAAPGMCRTGGALCYANRVGSAYRFVVAPSSPAWLPGAVGRPAPDDLVLSDYRRPELRSLTQAVAWMNEGWSYLERAESRGNTEVLRWRWMAEQATLGVTTVRATTVRFTLVLRSFGRPRRIRFTTDDRELTVKTVGPELAEYAIPPFQVGPGPTIITLTSLDGAEAPASSDPRRLSVALFHAQLFVED